MFCFDFGVCFGGVAFCLFDSLRNLRIINNSWQQKVSLLVVCHGGQVLKQSSGVLKNRTQKAPSLGKRGGGRRNKYPPHPRPQPVHFCKSPAFRRSLLAWPTSADWYFVIQVKNKTEVGIVLILALITSQENSRAWQEKKADNGQGCHSSLKGTVIFLLKEYLQFPRRCTRFLTAAQNFPLGSLLRTSPAQGRVWGQPPPGLHPTPGAQTSASRGLPYPSDWHSPRRTTFCLSFACKIRIPQIGI